MGLSLGLVTGIQTDPGLADWGTSSIVSLRRDGEGRASQDAWNELSIGSLVVCLGARARVGIASGLG